MAWYNHMLNGYGPATGHTYQSVLILLPTHFMLPPTALDKSVALVALVHPCPQPGSTVIVAQFSEDQTPVPPPVRWL